MKSRIIWAGLAACLATAILLTVYATAQQAYRQSANDPQVQIANDAARAAANGTQPDQLFSRAQVDIKSDLAPFVIVFDNSNQPLVGSGIYDGHVAQVPTGVLDYAKAHGVDRVTWQPDSDTRIALVVQKIEGDKGTVAVGRSLLETERRVGKLGEMVLCAWLASMFVIAVGFVAAGYIRK